MTQRKLLVFDLDGTLIDSRRDLVACVNATLQHHELRSLAPDQIAGFIGDGASALVQRSIQASGGDSFGLQEEALAFFLAHYREHLLDNTHVYPGVIAALAALQERTRPLLMAVLTNKPVKPSRRICHALGLSPYLFANFGGNSFSTKKPHPEGLRALWEEAQRICGQPIEANEVAMIGDSEIDIRTARNAGVAAWGCMWGFAVPKMLAEQPDAVANTPADWIALAGS